MERFGRERGGSIEHRGARPFRVFIFPINTSFFTSFPLTRPAKQLMLPLPTRLEIIGLLAVSRSANRRLAAGKRMLEATLQILAVVL